MKILSVEQIREVDAKTIKYDGIPSLELMKRASVAFYNWFASRYTDKSVSILIFSGIGNNGGDGLMIARLLYRSGYNVKVNIVEYSKKYSENCAHHIRRAKAENISLKKISEGDALPDITNYDIIIDAIFGTGLKREIENISKEIIKTINETGKTVISVDVPSGLFLDKKTEIAVHATETVTFQIPKLALFLSENEIYTGNLSIIPIGLNFNAIAEAETTIFYTEKEYIKRLIKPLSKFTHKGIQGHAFIIGGCKGKTGAVHLASKAALKSGCGLVTAFTPKCSLPILQTNLPELMVLEDESNDFISNIKFDLKPNAIGIGIGMGQKDETQEAFYKFLLSNKTPMVIDADGLNILSLHPEWLTQLLPKTILTPHPKELERLIGKWNNDHDKIEKTRLFAKKHDLIIVLKGAFTMIIDSEYMYVNNTGTPALATAGSGDVLTGIITSLLAQGYEPLESARIGVYIHGSTSNLTKDSIHPLSFVASDIIENISRAYFDLEK